jgi:hypothetical protein
MRKMIIAAGWLLLIGLLQAMVIYLALTERFAP